MGRPPIRIAPPATFIRSAGERVAVEQQAALTLLVAGRVQRVGFRRCAQEVARELGLPGWLKSWETRRRLTEALTLLRQVVEKLLGEKAA